MLESRRIAGGILIGLIAVISVTGLGQVWAQETTTNQEAPTNQEQIETLPEVTVKGTADDNTAHKATTGAKTDTPLRDLPASVVVVPIETLREQGATTMNDAMTNASGVQPVMGGSYGFANNFFIRGQAMRFLRDGYQDGTSQNGYWRTFADVERLEVLKGPGSALYGAGQPGGTVNVVTKQPSDEFGAELSGRGGSFNTWGGDLDVTGGLSDHLAARVIASMETSDGFRDLDRNLQGVLPSLTWRLNDRQVLSIDYDYRRLQVKPDNYGLIFNFQQQVVDVPITAHYDSPMNETEQTINRITLAHEWHLAPTVMMRTVAIQDGRDLSFFRNAGGNAGNAANVMTGRNLREQTDDATYLTVQNDVVWEVGNARTRHTVLVGAEYSDTEVETVRTGYNLPNITDIYNPVVPETSVAALTPVAAQGFDRDITSTGYAVYLQDQVAFGEQFKVRAGLREDRVKFRDAGSQGTTAFREVADTTGFLTGSLGTVWQPTSNTSYYVGWSNGKFINLATESTRVNVEPEASSQTEIGAKLSLLDGRLDVNSAVFETKRDNYYITLPGALDPTPDGEDRTRGVEVDLTAQPTQGWNVLVNFVWQDAENLSNTLATNAILGVTNQSISGKRPTGVAATGGRLWTSYRFSSNAVQGFGAGLGATYKGNSYADNLNLYKVPAYAVYDASVFYNAARWDVALNVRNLTDRRHFTNPTFSGALPGESRSAYVTASLKFD